MESLTLSQPFTPLDMKSHGQASIGQKQVLSKRPWSLFFPSDRTCCFPTQRESFPFARRASMSKVFPLGLFVPSSPLSKECFFFVGGIPGAEYLFCVINRFTPFLFLPSPKNIWVSITHAPRPLPLVAQGGFFPGLSTSQKTPTIILSFFLYKISYIPFFGSSQFPVMKLWSPPDVDKPHGERSNGVPDRLFHPSPLRLIC